MRKHLALFLVGAGLLGITWGVPTPAEASFWDELGKIFTAPAQGIASALTGPAGLAGLAITSSLNVISEAFSKASQTLADMFVAWDIGATIVRILEQTLTNIAEALDKANTIIFEYVFGDLMLLIDYQARGAAGKHVKDLYAASSFLALWLAVAFTLLGLGINYVRIIATKSLMPMLRTFAMAIVVILSIQFFPPVFTASINLTSAIANRILDVKVKGEAIRHAPKGAAQAGFMSAPLSGLSLLERRINDLKNLPSQALTIAEKKVNEGISSVTEKVETEANKVYTEYVDKPVTSAVNTGWDALAKQLGATGAVAPIIREGKTYIPPQWMLSCAVSIIKSIIAVTSLLLVLGLYVMKGFQLFSLLMLFVLAPLAFAFIVLPVAENVGLRLMQTIWTMLAWNIVWALGIKVYFIAALLVEAVNLGGGAADAGIPFAGLFMRMAAIAAMLAPAIWTAIFSSMSLSASMSQMTRQITQIPMLAGMTGAAAGGFASAGAGLVRGGFNAATSGIGFGAAILRQPKAVFSNVMSQAKGAVKNSLDSGFKRAIGDQSATLFSPKSPKPSAAKLDTTPKPTRTISSDAYLG
jgi:hypothetical protein